MVATTTTPVTNHSITRKKHSVKCDLESNRDYVTNCRGKRVNHFYIFTYGSTLNEIIYEESARCKSRA